MAEVSRVTGPGGPQDPKKEKSVSDTEKFKELMRVQKIGEVDEEQKKKRKRPEEAEEEAEAAVTAANQPTPTTEPSPLIPGKGKVGKLGAPSKAEAPSAPSAPTPLATPPPTAPAEDEGGFWEGDAYMQTFPSARAAAKPTPPPVQTQTPTPPFAPAAPEQPAAAAPAKAAPKAKTAEPKAPKIEGEAKVQEKKAEAPRKEEKAAYFEQAKKGKKMEEKRPEEMAEAVAPLPSSDQEQRITPSKSKKEEKIEEISPQTGQAPQGMPLPPTEAAAAPGPLPSYTYLHPQVLDIFERMVGVITVMTNAGISETTITLSAPQYTSSLFYGAQIIIQEFSTAPKAFNVQLIANPQAVKLFQANADDFMAAFQTGKYNFRINRIEASLASERPLFKRKESVSGEGKGKDKGQE